MAEQKIKLKDLTNISIVSSDDKLLVLTDETTNEAQNITFANLCNSTPFITGITSSDVITALGYTPVTSSSLNSYQLIAQDMTALSASGTIALSDNTINKITATGNVTFTLPSVSDLTKFHQIFVQLNMSSARTINVGTTYYFGGTAPDLSSAGTYNLIFEYDNTASHWVVGSLKKGASS